MSTPSSAVLTFLMKTVLKYSAYSLLFYSTATLSFDTNELAQNTTWQKLLHLKKDGHSLIKSASFFLSDHTQFSPANELNATIAAFQREPSSQCQFPARAKWLRSQGVPLPNPPACVAFDDWKNEGNWSSISLVFASGYMSNPASLYGHMLLKIGSQSDHNILLDRSVNYGAIVPEDENGLVYIAKGLFGGYQAGFSDQRFFHHHHNYSADELRDLWEYKLNLTPDEVELITKHLWELLNAQFDYYFADENCAFHIAQLIELVLDKPLTADLPPWVIPVTIFDRLNQAKHQDNSLVSAIHYIPSTSSKFYNLYEKLSPELRSLAIHLYHHQKDFNNEKYQQLPTEQKVTLLEVLMSFIQLQLTLERDETRNSEFKRVLLKERIKLPAGISKAKSHLAITPSDKAPHLATKPSKVSLAVQSQPDSEYTVRFGFRLTYFDSLSPDTARVKFSNLEMLDVELALADNDIDIYKFDVLDLESFNPSYAKGFDNQNWAWRLRLGYEKQQAYCNDCAFFGLNTAAGYAHLLNASSITFALATIETFSINNNYYLSPGIEVGLLSRLNNSFALRTSIAKNTHHATHIKLELANQLSPQSDVRIGWDYAETSRLSLQFNYYWD
ncbi:DUF4105 domain-containing protein [Pseudoalteromonas sp. OANN1]|uniref:Lnb N-terminal periplasmic domain-containing protein n=1 Tax=Pseudoalteromonas sp. OANN1 TaxID=2954497 RepID=UPI002096F107